MYAAAQNARFAPPPTFGAGGRKIFTLEIQLYRSLSTTKPVLPLPTSSALPCMDLLLGKTITRDSPAFRLTYDTAASCSVGELSSCSRIADAHPEVVQAVYTYENYEGIGVSGIVGGDKQHCSAELTVAFQFYLPYKTKTGEDVSLIIGTGPNVTANLIGLPFIKAAGAVFDPSDNVIECKNLDTEPFPVTQRTHSLVPDARVSSAPLAPHQEFRAGLRKLVANVQSSVAQVPRKRKPDRAVHFDDDKQQIAIDITDPHCPTPLGGFMASEPLQYYQGSEAGKTMADKV